MINIGTAVGYLLLDTTSFTDQMKEAKKDLETFGKDSTSATDKLQSLQSATETAGKAMTKNVTLPLVGIATAAVKTAADFEEGMSKVQAITGTVADKDLPSLVTSAEEMGLAFKQGSSATETAMNILSAKAQEMGAKTKFSASESADAFQYMAMAGWKAEDMLNGIEGIMNLAAASGEDLALTSDIVTDALTAFGLTAKDTSHFVDVLATASSNSNTNVAMLGESFKYVAPVAGALGYTVDDTALALGLMANSGIKASSAGTQLRTAITNMTKPTDKMKDIMLEYGLSLTDAEGNLYSLGEVMDDLRAKMAVTTDAQTELNWQMAEQELRLKGSVEMMPEEFEALDDMTEAEKKYTVALEYGRMAMERMSEAQQKDIVKRFLNRKEKLIDLNVADKEYVIYQEGLALINDTTAARQAEAAATLFGKEAMSGMLAIINASDADYEKLSGAIDNSAGSAKEMSEIMIDNLNGAITILKSAVEGLAISLGNQLIPYIRKVVDWITELASKLNEMSEGQFALITRIGAILAAIGPVLLIVSKVIKTILRVQAVIGGVVKIAQPLIKAISGVSKVFTDFVRMGDAISKVIGSFSQVGKVISLLASPIGIITVLIAGLIAALVSLWMRNEDFRNGIIAIWEDIKERIAPVVEGIKEIIEKLKETFSGVKDTISQALEQMQPAFDAIKEAVGHLFDGMADAEQAIVPILLAIAEVLMNVLGVAFSNVVAIVQTFFDVIGIVAQEVGLVFTAIANLVAGIIALIQGDTETAKMYFSEFVKNLVQLALSLPRQLLKILNSLFDNIIKNLIKFFSNSDNEVLKGIARILQKVLDFKNKFLDAGKSLMNSLFEGIKSVVGGILDFVDGTINKIKDAFSGVKSDADKITKTAVNGSHANGLAYVPFNGYIARLHEGERVLTKAENKEYSNGGSGGNTFNFYGTEKLDQRQTVKEFQRIIKNRDLLQ